jgi:hypothetical protein
MVLHNQDMLIRELLDIGFYSVACHRRASTCEVTESNEKTVGESPRLENKSSKVLANKTETPGSRILTEMEGSLAKQLVELLVSYEAAGRQFNTAIPRSRDCFSSSTWISIP